MSVLIVGGDKLGNITNELNKVGFTNIEHITGRKKSDRKENILYKAQKSDVVIVLIDFISHSLMSNLKNNIQHSKIIYAKRSWAALQQHIHAFINEGKVNM